VRRFLSSRGWGCILIAGILTCLGGCESLSHFFSGEKKSAPPPIEYTLQTPYSELRTFAVAPAINLSGSRDFDPYVISDTLFNEMQQVAGWNVLPLNKTLMAMRRLGIQTIDKPEDIRNLANLLGANAVVIPAVTAYDPYNPPAMGMILQLYDTSSAIPVAQVNAVFNATNQSVLRELRDFARGRTQYDSAMQDQKYLMDSDLYARFVCHAMVRRLIEVERERIADR